MSDPGLNKPAVKWYLKPVAVIIALFVAGPFALPLVWMSPSFKRWHKVTITVITALLTAWMLLASVELFKIFMKEIRSLQSVLM